MVAPFVLGALVVGDLRVDRAELLRSVLSPFGLGWAFVDSMTSPPTLCRVMRSTAPEHERVCDARRASVHLVLIVRATRAVLHGRHCPFAALSRGPFRFTSRRVRAGVALILPVRYITHPLACVL
jgi:hypothetical protein